MIVANYLVRNLRLDLDVADLNHDATVDVIDLVILANHLVSNINCLN